MLAILKQGLTREQERVETVLTNYSGFVREQFMLFVRSVRDPEVLGRVEAALASGNLDDAYSIIDSYVVRLGNAIVSMVPEVGRAEAEALAVQGGLARMGVAISFNPADPAVVGAMQRNRLEFIRDFGQDQRLAVNQALTEAARAGEGPVAAARRFRDSIGLTSYQQGMVDRYRQLLETNSRQALDRDLRDRRYDAAFENAIAGDFYLPPERINVMVGRYRERLLQLRAETIARTESGRVAETTRNISVEQAIMRAGVDRGLAVKQWKSTRDRRTRDSHAAMDGQARLFDDAFDSPRGATLMYPHDSDAPAEEVINCRCTVVHHIFETKQEADEYLAENGQGYYSGRYRP